MKKMKGDGFALIERKICTWKTRVVPDMARNLLKARVLIDARVQEIWNEHQICKEKNKICNHRIR